MWRAGRCESGDGLADGDGFRSGRGDRRAGHRLDGSGQFVGFQVIWNVSHSLHTPLMAVTNAISGIVIIGALLQIGSGNWLVVILASLSVLIATINIVGGFLVTRRMLAMFQKS